jgi:Holliday junction resolvase
MTKLSDMKEADVQRQIVDGLKARGAYVIVTHGPKNRPVCPGITDIIAVFPGRVLFVEVKGEGGKVSEEQREFLCCMRERGHDAFVADCWDDVERQI